MEVTCQRACGSDHYSVQCHIDNCSSNNNIYCFVATFILPSIFRAVENMTVFDVCVLLPLALQTIVGFGLSNNTSLIYFSSFPTWYTVFPSTYSICYPLSSTCFRPQKPIIRRSKLYMQPMVFFPFFLNGHTTKTSAEGENTIGCMYNLDLLMMGLWGLKHVEERW